MWVYRLASVTWISSSFIRRLIASWWHAPWGPRHLSHQAAAQDKEKHTHNLHTASGDKTTSVCLIVHVHCTIVQWTWQSFFQWVDHYGALQNNAKANVCKTKSGPVSLPTQPASKLKSVPPLRQVLLYGFLLRSWESQHFSTLSHSPYSIYYQRLLLSSSDKKTTSMVEPKFNLYLLPAANLSKNRFTKTHFLHFITPNDGAF